MKKMKRLLSLILTICMVLQVAYLPVGAEGTNEPTVAVRTEAIDGWANHYKLIYSVDSPKPVTASAFTISYDPSIIEAVELYEGEWVETLDIEDGASVDYPFEILGAYKKDSRGRLTLYESGLAKWAVNESRYAVSYAISCNDPSSANVDGAQDMFSFSFRVKDTAKINSKSIRFETDQSADGILAELYGDPNERVSAMIKLNDNSQYSYPQVTGFSKLATPSITYPGVENTPPVASVTVAAEKTTVEVNGRDVEVELTSAVLDSEGDAVPNKTAELSVESAYAELDEDVLVIDGMTPDHTEITVTASCDGKTGTATITVNRAVSVVSDVKLSAYEVEVDGINDATVTASAFDQFKEPIDVAAWSVNDKAASAGITIAANTDPETATVTIPKNAAASANYKIIADGEEASLTVTRAGAGVATAFEITNLDATVIIPTSAEVSKTITPAAAATDVYGDPVSVTWSVSGDENVSIDKNTGALTILSAARNAITVTATPAKGAAVSKTVVLTKASPLVPTNLTLSENSVVAEGYDKNDKTVTVTLLDQYGDAMELGEVTIAPENTGVSASGNTITVDNLALADTYTVTANGKTVELIVERETPAPHCARIQYEGAQTQILKVGSTKTYTYALIDQYGNAYTPQTTPVANWHWYKDHAADAAAAGLTVDAATGKVTVADNATYGDAEYCLKLTVAVDGKTVNNSHPIYIKIADREEMTIAGLSVAGGTYNGSAYAYTGEATATFEGSPVDLTGATVDVLYTNTADNSTSSSAPINAGTYKVAVTFKTADYIGTWTSDEYTIAKAVIDVSDIAWNAPEYPFTYNGSAKTMEVKEATIPAGVAVASYNGNVETNAGNNYTAIANLTLAEGYSAQNYVLSAQSVSYGWSIAPMPVTVMPEWNYDAEKPFVYDGTAKTVTASTTLEMIEFIYTGNEKIDVGEYTATAAVKVKDGYIASNYDFTSSNMTCAWEITRAEIDVPSAETGLVYTGAEQTGVKIGTGYTLTGNTGTNAQSYTATAQLDGNHKWSDGTDAKNIPWTIAPKAVKVTAVTVADKPFDNTTAATITGITFDDSALTASDYTASAVFDSADAAAAAQATVTVTVTNTNYQLTGEVPKATAAIAKADYTVTLTAESGSVKVGTNNTDFLPEVQSVTDDVAAADVAGGELNWYTDAACTTALTADYIKNLAISEQGASYTLYWKYTQTNANFEASKQGTYALTVTDGDPQNIEISGVPATVTYGDEGFILTTTVTTTGDAAVADPQISWTSSNPNALAIDAAGNVSVKGAAEDVVITATAAKQAGLYAQGTQTVTIDVAKKAVTVTADNKSKTYGEDNPALTITAPALVGEDTEADLGVTLTTAADKTSDVGTYDITGTSNSANYAVTITKGTLTITKAKVTVPTAVTGLVYNGSEKTGVAASELYNVAGGKETDKGDYTATVKLKDTTNYEWATAFDGTIAWSIAQAEPKSFNDKAAVAYSKAVTNEEQVLTVSLSDALTALGKDAAIKTVVESSDVLAAVADGTDVKITVQPANKTVEPIVITVTLSSNNYKDSTVRINVSIVDKTDVSDSIVFADKTVIWNGSAQALNAATYNNSSANFTYKVGEGEYGAMPTFTNAGTYTVTAKYEDAQNLGYKTATLKITNKVDLSVKPTVSTDEAIKNNGKYSVSAVQNETAKNATAVSVKGTKKLASYLSTDANQQDAEHKWIGLLIGTTLNGQAYTGDLYYSVDGQTFTKLTASDYADAAAHGGAAGEIVLWMATDVSTNLTRYIATLADGSDAAELTIAFKPYKNSSSSGSIVTNTPNTDVDEVDGDTVVDTVIDENPSVSKGTASAEISKSDLSAALKENNAAAKDEKADEQIISIDVTTKKDVDSTEITVPTKSVEDIADDNVALELETNNGTVKLDASALEQLTGAAKEDEITITVANDGKGNASVKAESDDEEIVDLGRGEAEITVDYDLPKGTDKDDVRVYHAAEGALDKNGNVIDATKLTEIRDVEYKKGDVTFVTDLLGDFIITTEALKGDLPFTDVDKNASYYDAIKFVYDLGLMVGVGDGTTFAPEAELSRAMVARMLHVLEKEPAAIASGFNDVARNFWYTNAIDWAATNGIIAGYGDGTYGPNDSLTREQLVVILYQYALRKGYALDLGAELTYVDAANTSFWAAEAVQWAVNNGILTANSVGYLASTEEATRATIAEAFMAFVQKYA